MITWTLNKFIPPPYRKNADSDALVAVFDDQFGGTRQDIVDVQKLRSAEECPEEFLPELGHQFAAGIKIGDTDRQKRQRIEGAVRAHKRRGRFDVDVKPRLDVITGFSSSIFQYVSGNLPNAWVQVSAATPAQQTVRGQGTTQVGILLESGTGPGAPFTVLIDLGGGAGLPAPVVEAAANELRGESEFAFFAIFLGYAGGIAGFTVYANGEV